MKAVSKFKVHSAEYKDSLPRKREVVDASTTKRVKRRIWQESANFWRTPETSY